MLPNPLRPTVATHWGTYRVRTSDGVPSLVPIDLDPDPSPIASAMIEARTAACRIRRPAIRRSFLEHGPLGDSGAGRRPRGGDSFVEVDWDTALDLLAGELDRVRTGFGNQAIYGGSYGWASAGRFHHAQSQVHRFLNGIGGYTRSFSNYSHAAGDVILPHVIGDKRGLLTEHTPWSLIAGHAELIVLFGGSAHKNAQVSSGGISRHVLRESLVAARQAGAALVSISPIRDDTLAELAADWLPVRPGTDVALMLGIAHTLVAEGLHDEAFLARHTTGFERFRAYLDGAPDDTPKTADWAASLTDIDADTIRSLARRMASSRTFISMSWSLQRADHGEQPYWMAVTLAAMLGQIGLPGGGFGFGYASVNGVGNAIHPFSWPSLPQGTNPVDDYIPVARVADMLLHPGEPYAFNGETRTYPDIRLVYWTGGNPFHHHQDLNRLVRAWQRPEVVVVQDSWWNPVARHADIVLPSATQLERNDISLSSRDRMIAASHRIFAPEGEARTDFEIFSGVAERLGTGPAFTEGRDEEGWLRHLYGQIAERVATIGLTVPAFETFWTEGLHMLPEPVGSVPLMAGYRDDPEGARLATPSGRIEIFSERIAGFGYADCPGHPTWLEPREWLGAAATARFPLHLISNQPSTKLHSQYDVGSHSRGARIDEREPVRMHPDDAAARGIAAGDVVRIFNDRGACLAAAVPSDAVRRGVVQIATGAWFDPGTDDDGSPLELHGNPNVLTADRGTSRLAQACSAHSCLVEIERYGRTPPPIGCYDPPILEAAAAIRIRPGRR